MGSGRGATTTVLGPTTDNEAMLRIFRDLGAHVGCLDERVYQLDIPVPEDPETLPNTPTGRVFKAVATRVGRSGYAAI